jgi:hypothetical protein
MGRLAPWILRGDRELRDHVKDGTKLLFSRGLHTDAGQLLYLLDGYDFARFLRRFNSPQKEASYRAFEDPSKWHARTSEDDAKLSVMQWQNTKAKKRTKLPLLESR